MKLGKLIDLLAIILIGAYLVLTILRNSYALYFVLVGFSIIVVRALQGLIKKGLK